MPPERLRAPGAIKLSVDREVSGVDQLAARGVGDDRTGVDALGRGVDVVPDGALDVRHLAGGDGRPVLLQRLTVLEDGRVQLARLGVDALLDDQLAPARLLEGGDLVEVFPVTGVRMELAGTALAGVLQLVLAGAVLAVRLRSSHGSLLSR